MEPVPEATTMPTPSGAPATTPAADSAPATRQQLLTARRQAKAQQLRPYRVSGWERRFRWYEKRPLIQKTTDKHTGQIDDLCKAKEQELMEI